MKEVDVSGDDQVRLHGGPAACHATATLKTLVRAQIDFDEFKGYWEKNLETGGWAPGHSHRHSSPHPRR